MKLATVIPCCWMLHCLSGWLALGQESFSPLRGPYMGREADHHPGIFLPGKISTGANEGSAVFFRGARSFLWSTDREGIVGLFLLQDRDGRWQPPERIRLFPGGSRVLDFTLSPDGGWFYFSSDAEVEGMDGSNLWKVRFESGRFRNKELLGSSVNTPLDEEYPSITRGGDLYFCRTSREDPAGADLWVAGSGRPAGDAAARLNPPVNGPFADCDPFVSPDGTYLIFSPHRPGGLGAGDLYVSYLREDGNWTEPIHLGPEINSEAEESRPSVTPDGRYFFFVSSRIEAPELPRGVPPARSMPGNGSRDIYWMKADFLEQIRNTVSGAKKPNPGKSSRPLP